MKKGIGIDQGRLKFFSKPVLSQDKYTYYGYVW